MGHYGYGTSDDEFYDSVYDEEGNDSDDGMQEAEDNDGGNDSDDGMQDDEVTNSSWGSKGSSCKVLILYDCGLYFNHLVFFTPLLFLIFFLHKWFFFFFPFY